MSGGPLSVGPSQYICFKLYQFLNYFGRSARETSLFLTSALGASALIIPFFLHHLEKIPLTSALMACGGTILLFITVIVYQIFFNAEDDNSM